MKIFPIFNKRKIRSERKPDQDLGKVHEMEAASSRNTTVDPDKRKNEFEFKNNDKQKDEAKDHFDSLKATAELVNVDLQKNNSPYRFYIYLESEEVFINLVRLDDAGKIIEVKKKNITHQEFSDWIRHIENGEGLFIDSVG